MAKFAWRWYRAIRTCGYEGALHLFPQAEARLRGAAVNGVEQGAVSASRRLHSVTRGCVALVGDASGSVDAITGQGLCLAMQQSARWRMRWRRAIWRSIRRRTIG